MRVCFSYAAYTKSLIDHLKSSNILVEKGLTDVEFTSIESVFHFSFPPDLRSILQEGLPVGNGFPNWRSSIQQIKILVEFPILQLCKEVSRNNFWIDSWGVRPYDDEEAVNLAKGFLRKAPVLVQIYQNCYIPTWPCMAGNPIFYVHGCEIKLMSFDIAGFYQQFEFRKNNEDNLKRPTLSKLFNAPIWAATEARRVEFWTDLADRGENVAPWWGNGELKGSLEGMCGRLRNGGWKEEDVREMMIMNGCDQLSNRINRNDDDDNSLVIDKEQVVWHVRLLSKRLLRAGWSTDEVMESLGRLEDNPINEDGDGDEDYLFEVDNIIASTLSS